MDTFVIQYTQLYEFFRDNLSDGSNYQRLITTLNLLNILFEDIQSPMTENQKKKRIPTKDHLKTTGKWHFESPLLRDRVFNCLKDDTNDVRLMAKHLLITYFSFTKEETDTFQENLRLSLETSKSNVFYTAESGAYAVAVLANLFYKSESLRNVLSLNKLFEESKTQTDVDFVCESLKTLKFDTEDNNSRQLFSRHYLYQCHVQSEFLQSDILLAVKNKNSLHGALTTLMLLLTDPCSPEFCALDLTQVNSLLNLLNETCLYLLDILCMKSKSTNFAPSFGEMGEAMVSLINAADDTEHLTITPAHQALFNCIWMNLKICCTFASELAVAYTGQLSRDQVVFSCGIVSHVLHKCRHKGAIQNAGLALASIVSKCLYEDTYPLDLLLSTMKSVFNCAPGGTVSRKSAGVAILVHKILSSNHSLKNELFVTAMDKIIQVASSHVETTEETLKIDLPQAIAFHMLQFLIADSGLRVPMAAYLERITMLCFEKMQCQEWTVRNAALQVFGVLLPKLVGTKKQDCENQSSNVAFEEFFYQLPRIGDSLSSVLSPLHEGNTSVLVSALTLLSRLKTTGDLIPLNEKSYHLKQFFSHVYSSLLSSNIHTIRFLVANCYVNSLHSHAQLHEHFKSILFSCLEYIAGHQVLTERFHTTNMKLFLNNKSRAKIVSENHLHGSLLTLEILKERIYLENLKFEEEFLSQLMQFLNISNPCSILARDVNYSTYSLLFKMFRHENKQFGMKKNSEINFLSSMSSENKDFKRQIGWKLLVQEVLKFHMFFGDKIDFNHIQHLVATMCLEQDSDILRNVLVYMSTLLQENNLNIRNNEAYENSSDIKRNKRTRKARICIRNMLTTVVGSDMSKICAEQVFHVVIQIYNLLVEDDRLEAVSSVDTVFLTLGSMLLEVYCRRNSIEYTCPLVLPVVSLCSLFSSGHGAEDAEKMELLKEIKDLCETFIQNENCNEEFRFNAAMAMSILHQQPDYKSLYQKDMIVNAVHLLQDEVYEVRQEIIYFIRNWYRFNTTSFESPFLLKNPYLYLLDVTKDNRIHIKDVLLYLDILSDLLFITEQDMHPLEADLEFCNPFDHNLRNFYSEPVFVTQYISSVFNRLLNSKSVIFADGAKVSKLLGKCSAHIEEHDTNARLKEQGKMKLRILKETASALRSILHEGC